MHLSYVVHTSQIYNGDFAKFCGLPRIYELKLKDSLSKKHEDNVSDSINKIRKAQNEHLNIVCQNLNGL